MALTYLPTIIQEPPQLITTRWRMLPSVVAYNASLQPPTGDMNRRMERFLSFLLRLFRRALLLREPSDVVVFEPRAL
ncbi:unnamed protein product [Caenorhabditis auriculariae]|uniref:Uncharacterized protein n=1 Tax=Caenorhabditis auriculariae TaxID=2777116 RepID=A0A8S1HIS3_9PELO|nr:unnamed protein product [Caenorhabditis auriculariae]